MPHSEIGFFDPLGVFRCELNRSLLPSDFLFLGFLVLLVPFFVFFLFVHFSRAGESPQVMNSFY